MKAADGQALRLASSAIAFFTLFAFLGAYVSSHPVSTVDLAARSLVGEATPVAIFFTSLGRWYAIVAISAIVGVTAFVDRTNALLVPAVALSQAAAQGVSFVFKASFARARPDYAIVYHEPDFSYPSGHAITAVVLYVGLALVVLRTRALPRLIRIPMAATLVIFAIGIPWSRLALGAHYLTDVIGGLLFGGGWFCVQTLVVRRLQKPGVLV
jgi:membrane-associated phospholipid phosphatase